MNRWAAWVSALAACTLLAAGEGRAGDYSMSVDGEGTRGEYGTGIESTVGSLTLGLQYQGERFGWSVAVPWLVVEAPAELVVSGGMVQGGGRKGRFAPGSGSATTVSKQRTESGPGDVTLGAGLLLVKENDTHPFFGVSGKVKLATADEERGLGTGANDYSLQWEAAKSWLSGRVGYRWLGNTDETDFRNVAYGALAVTYYFASGADAGAEYFGEEAVAEGGDGRRELSFYASRRMGERWQLRGYLLKGLSDASPDVGVGLGLVADL